MGISFKDIREIIEWLTRRKRKVYRPSSAKQPKPSHSLPCPRLNAVTFDPYAQVGEPFMIMISATNIGTQAAAGGITISFPDISRNGQEGYVELEASEVRVVIKEEGSELKSSDDGQERKFVAKYLMRETELIPWRHEEETSLKLNVTSVKEGIFRFYVTVWAATGDWKKIIRSPIVKEITDQQEHAVYHFVVRVLSAK